MDAWSVVLLVCIDVFYSTPAGGIFSRVIAGREKKKIFLELENFSKEKSFKSVPYTKTTQFCGRNHNNWYRGTIGYRPIEIQIQLVQHT